MLAGLLASNYSNSTRKTQEKYRCYSSVFALNFRMYFARVFSQSTINPVVPMFLSIPTAGIVAKFASNIHPLNACVALI